MVQQWQTVNLVGSGMDIYIVGLCTMSETRLLITSVAAGQSSTIKGLSACCAEGVGAVFTLGAWHWQPLWCTSWHAGTMEVLAETTATRARKAGASDAGILQALSDAEKQHERSSKGGHCHSDLDIC